MLNASMIDGTRKRLEIPTAKHISIERIPVLYIKC